MKKILAITMILFAFAGISYAYMTVEQARSAEQLRNEGYSKSTIQLVQQESGEYNPKPTNKFQKTGFRIWNWWEASSPKARDNVNHEIKTYPSYTDY